MARQMEQMDEEDEESQNFPLNRYVPVQIAIPYEEGDWKRPFLEQLSRFPNVGKACEYAQISRSFAMRTKKNNKKFAELWDECLQAALDQLEENVFNRSMNPWDPGSASLAKFLLTHHRPEVYNPGKVVQHDHEIHTKDDKPVKIQVETVDYRNFLGELAPPDHPLIEGQKVEDIEDDDFAEYREIVAEE
jgi:hypothetical protein